MNRPASLLLRTALGGFCLSAALLSYSTPAAEPAQSNPRPNVIVILLDDCGYGDFGFMGSEIQTPTMDRLARQGALLTNFYNYAQCVPSRGSLMHGVSAHLAGYGEMREHPRPNSLTSDDAYQPIRKGVIGIAEALKPAGYQTCAVGKWHMSGRPGAHPLDRGFDRFYGFIGGASFYLKAKLDAQKVAQANWQLDRNVLQYDKDFPENFYATDAFTDFALKFVEGSDPAKPFFLYMAYNAPHWPLDALPDDIAKYKSLYEQGDWQEVRRARFERQKQLGLIPKEAVLPDAWPRSLQETPDERAKAAKAMASYAAMLDRVDQNIGRLVSLLEKRGVLDNTLILLCSDNGADTVHGDGWMQVNNAPFRLAKTFAHEGGCRTPLVASWPKRIPAGTLNLKQVGHIKDILPTILAATGSKLPETNPRNEPVRPLEGQDLLPALCDSNTANNRPLCIERMGNEMIRDGDWKLVRRYNFDMEKKERGALFMTSGPRTGPWELYNLANDPTETKNLFNSEPERAAKMEKQYRAWADSVGVIDREQLLKKPGFAPSEKAEQ